MIKVLIVIFFITSFLYSEIIEVSLQGNCDYLSIQEAIENSSNSDTVLVNPGIYYETA